MKKYIAFAISAVGAFLLVTGVFASQSQNVTICHATGSQNNPYNQITVDASAVDGQGNNDHNSSQHQNGNDIIPPGFWDSNGRNWTTQGQAIWNNHCSTVFPTPTVQLPTATPTQAQIQPTTTLTPTPTVVIDECTTCECKENCEPSITPSPEPTREITPTPVQETQKSVSSNDSPLTNNTTSTPECSDRKPDKIAWATYIPTNKKGEQEIRWANEIGAETVNIRYREAGEDWKYGAVGIPNTGNYVVKDLKSGKAYWYQIAGVHGCMAGEWSAPFDPVVK